jgi:hypothetical protein
MAAAPLPPDAAACFPFDEGFVDELFVVGAIPFPYDARCLMRRQRGVVVLKTM